MKTKIPGFELRNATESDVPLVLSFIRDLAEYEKLSDEVVATEDQIRAALFGDRKVAEVIFGHFEGKPAGFALFFHNFSTFLGRPGIYLEDLFVKPEYRGKGFGKLLLAYLAKLAVERNCGRLEWAVLDWNEPAIKFYESLGAQPMEEWVVNRLIGEPLVKLSEEL